MLWVYGHYNTLYSFQCGDRLFRRQILTPKVDSRAETVKSLTLKPDIPQETRDIQPMLFQCWASVEDAGPTLKQH